nr:Mariner Mos1 transposase [Hymenolepis microstoma]
MCLRFALKEKPPQYNERYDKVVILQHDNARPPHVAKVVKKYLEMLKLKISIHTLYSTDFDPSYFYLAHLFQWHTARLTGNSVRTKKFKIGLIDSWILSRPSDPEAAVGGKQRTPVRSAFFNQQAGTRA